MLVELCIIYVWDSFQRVFFFTPFHVVCLWVCIDGMFNAIWSRRTLFFITFSIHILLWIVNSLWISREFQRYIAACAWCYAFACKWNIFINVKQYDRRTESISECDETSSWYLFINYNRDWCGWTAHIFQLFNIIIIIIIIWAQCKITVAIRMFASERIQWNKNTANHNKNLTWNISIERDFT